MRLVWQMGHIAGQCRPLPKRSPSRGAITTLDVVQASFGGAMPDPFPTTYGFDAGNKRRGAAMRTGIVVLAYVVLYGNAVAATEYAVDGLVVGTQLNFGNASYREYKCSPSDQFDGHIWCQKTRTDKDRRGSYITSYSLLHSQDGNISYISRSQEPAFLNPKEAELNIQRYSRKIGESPRIMKMPHRSGLPDGLMAVWGEITLEPLDQESIKILAAGKSPKKGFLIDYLRNFARSAKEGLPIYRIDGGPGFIWTASFDHKGRGTLRLVAVEISGFSPPPAPVVVATASPTHQQEQLPSGLNQTIEKLQADLAVSTNKIAELEKAKSDAERAVKEAEQAKLDAENAKQEVEQTKIAEKMTSDALVSQRADEAAAGAKTGLWETALYGSVGGLLVALTTSTIGFFINRRRASVSKQSIGEPIEASARSRAELETLSPGIAISEAAFERELEEEVATINAAKDEAVLVGPSQGGVGGQLGAVVAHDRCLGLAALAKEAIERDPDAGDRRVGQTFARAVVDHDEDTRATSEPATSGNSATIMISSASWTKRILTVDDATFAKPWEDRTFGAIVVEISTPVVVPVAADRKLEVLWSQVNDTAPRSVDDGVGASDRVELVQKRSDMELGGVDAEATGDHLV